MVWFVIGALAGALFFFAIRWVSSPNKQSLKYSKSLIAAMKQRKKDIRQRRMNSVEQEAEKEITKADLEAEEKAKNVDDYVNTFGRLGRQ